MSKAIGEVSRIDGEFIVKAGDGTLKLLAPGTLLYEDDVIQGRAGSRELEIQLTNGDVKVIGGDGIITLSESVISKEPPMAEEREIDSQQVAKITDGVHGSEWIVNADPERISGMIDPEHFVARAFLEHDTVASDSLLGINSNTPDALGGIGATGVVPEPVSAAAAVSVESTASAVSTAAPVNPAAEAQAAASQNDNGNNGNHYGQENQAANNAAASQNDNGNNGNHYGQENQAANNAVVAQAVVDVLATEAAGIYERDGHYYKTETHEVATNTVDVVALEEMGYTLKDDGNIYKVHAAGEKIEIEQEVTKIVTKEVAVDPIMKTVTTESTVTVEGAAFENHPGTISKNATQTIALGTSTNDISIHYNAYDTGSVEIKFLNNGQVVDTIQQGHTGSSSVEYNLGQTFNTIEIDTHGQALQIDSITGHSIHNEVVTSTTFVPDTEAMVAAGITVTDHGYVQTVQETQTTMEKVLVDAPDTLVNPSDIPGGVPMVMENQTVEVAAEPIMTTQTLAINEHDSQNNHEHEDNRNGDKHDSQNNNEHEDNRDGDKNDNKNNDGHDSHDDGKSSHDSIDFSGLSDMANNTGDHMENPLSGEISLGQIFTLDQDPNVALFEENTAPTGATPVATDTTPAATETAPDLHNFYVDASHAALVVEQPVDVAAT